VRTAGGRGPDAGRSGPAAVRGEAGLALVIGPARLRAQVGGDVALRLAGDEGA
jgi:hypothetical protein